MAADGISISPESTGPAVATYSRVVGGETRHFQYVIPTIEGASTFKGYAATFRITGRAAATQNLLTIFNASATTLVRVDRIVLDTYDTAPRIITTHPAIARVSRLTAAATNGTALAKVAMDTSVTTDASVTLLQDASADGTNSGTALTATIAAGTTMSQEVLSRNVWLSGTAPPAGTWTELADRMEFFSGEPDVVLRQTQGLALHLTSPAAASIPATSFFAAAVYWEEFTP